MASNNVLNEAINKLEIANMTLRKKMHDTNDKTKADVYHKEIIRNQAMILDYKFRLEHE